MDLLIRFTPLSHRKDGSVAVWSFLVLSKDFSMQAVLKDFDRLFLSSSSKMLHFNLDLPGVELASFSIDVSSIYEDTCALFRELGIDVI